MDLNSLMNLITHYPVAVGGAIYFLVGIHFAGMCLGQFLSANDQELSAAGFWKSFGAYFAFIPLATILTTFLWPILAAFGAGTGTYRAFVSRAPFKKFGKPVSEWHQGRS